MHNFCRKCGERFIQLQEFGLQHPTRSDSLTSKGKCPHCKSIYWYDGNLTDKAKQRCRERVLEYKKKIGWIPQ